MARTEANLTCGFITQDFQPEHWAWTDEENKQLLAKDVQGVAQIIKSRLERIGCEIVEMYSVRHNKDQKKEWDDVKNEYVLTYKTDHIHSLIKFRSGKGATLPAIATAVGVAPEFVEKAGKGKYGYDNLVAYLIHIKYPDKYQYDPKEVLTVCGRSYMNVYMERRLDWEKGRAKVQSQKFKADVDWLESMILTGKITRQQINLTDEYYQIFARNRRRCLDAMESYTERKTYQVMQSMENGEFKLSVIYITGRSGSGKSFFTEQLVRAIKKWSLEATGTEWLSCGCANSNPFDDYMGEEILVMDDLRGIALDASAWLKLLDPDRVQRIGARFHNKQRTCRVIIINSEKDVLDFFYYLKNSGGGNRSEAMDQFFRRIMAHVQVYRIDDYGNRIESGLPQFQERRACVRELEQTESYKVEMSSQRYSNVTNELELNFAHKPKLSLNGERVDLSMFTDTAINYLVRLIAERNGYCTDGDGEDTPFPEFRNVMDELENLHNDTQKDLAET